MGFIVDRSIGLDGKTMVQHHLTTTSANKKTANVATLWHTVDGENSYGATQSGKDSAVCGSCSKRPILYRARYEKYLAKFRAQGMTKKAANVAARKAAGEPCYVETMKGGPGTSNSGNHKPLPLEKIPLAMEIEGAEVLRFGGWGNPSSMPRPKLEAVVKSLQAHNKRWLMYISADQWMKPENQWLRHHCQASVTGEKQYRRAQSMGWNTFRVREIGDRLFDGEGVCPASAEAGKVSDCATCLGCDGKKSYAIYNHGLSSDVRKLAAKVRKQYKGQLVDLNKLIKREIIQAELDAAA